MRGCAVVEDEREADGGGEKPFQLPEGGEQRKQ